MTNKNIEEDVRIGKKGLNFATCNYIDMDTDRMCGAFAAHKVPMPYDIPALPICSKHIVEFDDWTIEDTEMMYEAILAGEL